MPPIQEIFNANKKYISAYDWRNNPAEGHRLELLLSEHKGSCFSSFLHGHLPELKQEWEKSEQERIAHMKRMAGMYDEHEEFKFCRDNYNLLHPEFEGLYVAVADRKILTFDDRKSEVIEQVFRYHFLQDHPRVLIVKVFEPDSEFFMKDVNVWERSPRKVH